MQTQEMVRRIERGGASAMRAFHEDLCRQHGIAWRYTADPGEWCAWPARRVVSVPPPCDLVALAICLHECGHVAIGVCPRTGLHFDSRRGCLQCETNAWRQACTWFPFSRDMRERMRAALRSYRRGVRAPYEAMQRADEALGSVRALEALVKRWKFDEKLQRQARVMASIGRQR